MSQQVAATPCSVGAPRHITFERALATVRAHVCPEVAALAGGIPTAWLFACVRLDASVRADVAANVPLPSRCVGAAGPRAFVRSLSGVHALMLT